ncbi:APC family permease [Paracidovorax konjaci]|uniref:Amino acid efflux transporter n=1 Tax=Paracidovorax konjaci TaxID=32040 RepID=A0A1I1ZIP2_9BURK|nr:amino acid permease [Paracidovorax konjaci]SFE31557.1 amino acid efflux transporter [Paracidovorax konjaci]
MQLQRHIGSRELLAFYISSVAGAGVLIIPGIAAQIAGPASVVAWALLALVTAPVAVCFAKMAMLAPESGGVPAFIEKSLHPRLGKTLSLLLTLSIVVSDPIMGLAAAHYLHSLLHFDRQWIPLVGYVFLLAALGFNAMGMKIGGKIQSAAVFILVAGLIAIIAIALPQGSADTMTPFMPQGFASIGSAMVVCFFAFLGWENVSSIAGEVRDPERTFRRVIPWAVLIVSGLYGLIALTYVSVVPAAERATAPTVLTPILRIAVGEPAAAVGSAVAIVLLLLAVNSWVMGASRQIFSLARKGLLPSALGRWSAPQGAPRNALAVLAVIYGVFTLCLTFFHIPEEGLIQFANANFIVIYLFAFGTALKVFRSARMRACAWIAILASAALVPLLGKMVLISLGIAAVLFIGLAWRENHLARRPPAAAVMPRLR